MYSVSEAVASRLVEAPVTIEALRQFPRPSIDKFEGGAGCQEFAALDLAASFLLGRTELEGVDHPAASNLVILLRRSLLLEFLELKGFYAI